MILLSALTSYQSSWIGDRCRLRVLPVILKQLHSLEPREAANSLDICCSSLLGFQKHEQQCRLCSYMRLIRKEQKWGRIRSAGRILASEKVHEYPGCVSLTSLCLSFLIWKMSLITLMSQYCYKDRGKRCYICCLVHNAGSLVVATVITTGEEFRDRKSEVQVRESLHKQSFQDFLHSIAGELSQVPISETVIYVPWASQ